MCNAWNHSPGCTCGWGGDGHLGAGGDSSSGGTAPAIGPFRFREGALTSYRLEKSDFCRPTTCPECGEQVFFIRHNGGSVWVDELGWPWPKHDCFDESTNTAGYRFIADVGVRYTDAAVKPKLGRVIKRIYQYSFHIYLIATHDGRLCALRAKRSERTIFSDLVSIRYTKDSIFLEDNRNRSVPVKNFAMAESVMEDYLGRDGDVFYGPKERDRSSPPLPLGSVTWSIAKQKFEPKAGKEFLRVRER